MIRVRASEPIRKKGIELGVDDTLPEIYRKTYLNLALSEGFGSGFVIKSERLIQTAATSLVITNQHVIADADQPRVSFDHDETQYLGHILFSDRRLDLAILEIRASVPGLTLNATSANIQDVFAVGYPSMNQDGSYQETHGNISNPCLHDRELTKESTHGDDCWVKHTAAIDPGSSGGPLLTKAHEVIGVNTAILTQLHDAFLAVPATAIQKAIQDAELFREKRTDATWLADQLKDRCRKFNGELSSTSSDHTLLVSFISNSLMAEQGNQAYQRLVENIPGASQQVIPSFFKDPAYTLRASLVMALRYLYETRGGVAKDEQCTRLNPNDDVTKSDATVRIMISLQRGSDVELVWMLEHGAWRLRDYNP